MSGCPGIREPAYRAIRLLQKHSIYFSGAHSHSDPVAAQTLETHLFKYAVFVSYTA